jgi:hypothetical protein
MDIYLTNNTFFDAKASYTTTIYANTPTVFVCEITSQTNKRGALIGPTNQQVVANTVCWFIEHPDPRKEGKDKKLVVNDKSMGTAYKFSGRGLSASEAANIVKCSECNE